MPDLNMIRSVQPDDLETITRLTPPGWTDLRPVFDRYLQNPQVEAVKFCEGEQLCGVGASIRMERTAWLAHIVVDAQFRGRGIAGSIVEYLCDRLERSGVETVSLLATDLGEPVYVRCGFRTVGHYAFLTLPQAFRVEQMPLRAYAPQDLEAVLDFDLRYAGENRASLLLPHLSSAMLAFEGSTLRGYYLPELGEGHVVADSHEAALSLLSLRSHKSLTCGVPVANEYVLDALIRQGAQVEEKYIARMERGMPLHWNAYWCCARIAGKLG